MIHFIFSLNKKSSWIAFPNGSLSQEYVFFEDAVEAIEKLYIAGRIDVDHALTMLDSLLEKSELEFKVDLNLSPFDFMQRLDADKRRSVAMERVKIYVYENKLLLPGFYRCPSSLDHWHIFLENSISPPINTVSFAEVLLKKYRANGLIPPNLIDIIAMQITDANLPHNIYEN